MQELDLIDRRILYELDLNARISASQLARKIKKSKETVNFRVNRLLSQGYLKGFYSVLNTSKMGWYYYKLYLKFKNSTPAKEQEILGYLSTHKHIAYLASVEGNYDCLALVMIRGPEEMVSVVDAFMGKYGSYVQEKEIVTVLAAHRLNQRFLYPGEQASDTTYPVKLGAYPLDETDKRILNITNANARMPLTEIASKVGADAKVVKYRLRKLERDGIILGYVTSLNFDRIGTQFTQLNISLTDPTRRRAVIEFFSGTRKCLFAVELLGKYDLTIELHLENNQELKSIMNQFRETFAGSYQDYDICAINKEHVMVWSPFLEKN
ncbi:MAG: Lrp/AsnC family transcriptional regulator [Nanoarchaeota archaeon]|nr:Lrp/AsnC family transcriptional regulator [Nanoarchaeota archaeon]